MKKLQAAYAAFKNPALVSDGLKVRHLANALTNGNFAIISSVGTGSGALLKVIQLNDSQRVLIRNLLPKLGLRKAL